MKHLSLIPKKYIARGIVVLPPLGAEIWALTVPYHQKGADITPSMPYGLAILAWGVGCLLAGCLFFAIFLGGCELCDWIGKNWNAS